jgi:Lrp/AsnC family transcriptional regulator, regulator for asnA, asnC and gidA
MDGRDKAIIEALIEDSRTPYVELARKLKITEAAIRKRVRNLQETGIISKFTIRVDPSLIGFESVAIIGIDARPDALVGVQSAVRRMKGVRYTSLASGDHMLLFGVWCHDQVELRAVISKVKKMKGVTKVCPAVLLKNVEYCE